MVALSKLAAMASRRAFSATALLKCDIFDELLRCAMVGALQGGYHLLR